MERLGTTSLKIPVNRLTCILFYLGKILNIDMSHLFYIYKKFSSNTNSAEDTLYMFFMLAGKKISIPKVDRLVIYINNADSIYDKITKNPDRVITKIKDLEIYRELVDSLDNDTMEIEL